MNFETIFGVANIVLTLLLLFQWDRKHASEQATKLNILAIRRMINRVKDPVASDITDSLDATLAALDARSPFIEWGQKILSEIRNGFKKDSTSPLMNAPERNSTTKF